MERKNENYQTEFIRPCSSKRDLKSSGGFILLTIFQEFRNQRFDFLVDLLLVGQV